MTCNLKLTLVLKGRSWYSCTVSDVGPSLQSKHQEMGNHPPRAVIKYPRKWIWWMLLCSILYCDIWPCLQIAPWIGCTNVYWATRYPWHVHTLYIHALTVRATFHFTLLLSCFKTWTSWTCPTSSPSRGIKALTFGTATQHSKRKSAQQQHQHVLVMGRIS